MGRNRLFATVFQRVVHGAKALQERRRKSAPEGGDQDSLEMFGLDYAGVRLIDLDHIKFVLAFEQLRGEQPVHPHQFLPRLDGDDARMKSNGAVAHLSPQS